MDWTDYLRYVMSLIFVLALMAGLYLLLKRFGVNGMSAIQAKRRLQIVEILPLDGRRRAVLLRRDSQEHLVILGPAGETVIETNIKTDFSGAPSADNENDPR